ncbi:bifunctional enoyl-CoA hydratase/phosphate acetyltransferase [Alkalicoccus luteus]|uniref:bifunctional enoyl-CoA hydratase/phosphate acetyltransferase n=1 Tax=Alkalicoccus luteus TaxID=1237094 RepID=UPI004033B232
MNVTDLTNKVHNKSEQVTVAVAHAVEPSIFTACSLAAEKGTASFHFIGPLTEMTDAMKDAAVEQSDRFSFSDAADEAESAQKAVVLVHEGQADVLMKGMTPTSKLLKAVLHKEKGLRTGRLLSHLAGFQLPEQDDLLFLTDAAMNIAPDLTQKQGIIENAVEALSKMGMELPKTALLAAVETVNPAMPAAVDAAVLTQMNRRGQLAGCLVDGPLALDVAVSAKAAKQKGLETDVAGRADLLVAPNIETGNTLYKSLTLFGGATVGGMIVGARAPIVLTSRSDTAESRLFSLLMAVSTIQK